MSKKNKGRMANYRKLAHALVKNLRQEDLSEVMVCGRAYSDIISGSYRNAVQVTLTYITKDGEVYQGTGIAYKNPGDAEYVLSIAVRIARGRAELSLGMQMLAVSFGDVNDYLDETLIKSVHRLPGDIKWKDVANRKRKSLSLDDIMMLLDLWDDEDMLVLSADQPLP